MPKIRSDISNAEIMEQYSKTPVIAHVAKYFGCSTALIRSVVNGKRTKEVPKKYEGIDKSDMCTCCGLRPKKRGNLYLCEGCFTDVSPFAEGW